MKKLLFLRPRLAFRVLFIIPSILLLISIIIGSIWELSFFFALSFFILLLQALYLYFWRLSIGILTYNSLPEHIEKPVKKHFLFLITMIIYFPGTLVAILWSIGLNSNWFFIFLIIILFFAWPVSYFQCNYVAKNISINYHNKLLIKELWPLNWVTIGFYPMTAKKVHEIIIKSKNIKPTPNNAYKK